MGSGIRMVGWLMVLAIVVQGTAADTYTVGDSLGWTVPPVSDFAYKVWAGKESFDVGDVLVFNWTRNHTVARVSKEIYDDCRVSNVSSNDVSTTSPVNYTLTSNETQYFICTIDTHCSLGQKVTISISSASSLTVGAVTAILMVMLVSFFSNI